MSDTRTMKSYEELEFRDDFMFGKIMEDKEICREVLECLLQRPIGELQEVQTQKEFKYVSDGKPIRLDVYNRDSDGVIYDTEMQNLNKKSVNWHALPKRSRFYQGLIDIDHIDKSGTYKTLPDSNVVFICTFDPFGYGLSQYTFCERCNEKPGLTLCDGTEKHYYNCTYEGDDISQELRDFYDYVMAGKMNGSLTKKIDKMIGKARKNEEWRSAYMKERTLIMDAREEGREEGIEQGIEQSIENMLRNGKSVEEIVNFCGYTYEQVKKVEDSLLTTAK